jgi:predicted transcriptional regulator
MKNVQITIDPETLAAVDHVAKPLGLKRSEIVPQALREWLRRRSIATFEDEWMRALRRQPDDDAEEWLAARVWTRK